VALFSLENNNKGLCKAVCRSQMCGIQHNNVQAVQLFDNDQYDLLIRNCDDLFLQPILPFKPAPHPIHPSDVKADVLVVFNSLVRYTMSTL
jgi:hypothetical protein